MQAFLKGAFAALGLAIASHATAQITLYEHEGFQGLSFTTEQSIEDFGRQGFNDRASSAVVQGERWEVCEDARFGGRCTVLREGRYPSLAALDLNDRVSSVRAAGRDARADDGRYESGRRSSRGARITFFENEGFKGRSFTTEREIGNFERFGFNDRASSAIVEGDGWEVCDDVRFRGRCVVLEQGRYRNLAAMRLNDRVSSAREADADRRGRNDRSAPVRPAPPVEQQGRITLFEREGFEGRSFSTDHAVDNIGGRGFSGRAYSAIVEGGAAGWEVCHAARVTGGCAVLRPGRYADLAVVGVNDRIASVRAARSDRRVGDDYHDARQFAAYDSRRRPNERLYEADVTSVRAVVQTPEQRCWVEPGQVAEERGGANVPGAVLGAVIGGILGHQVGSGRGKDLATAGGAVAGAAVGANVGRDGGSQGAATQNVQRCSTAPASARPDYWDVTYFFRGMEHHTQMTAPPGRTVTVNEQGEPRS